MMIVAPPECAGCELAIQIIWWTALCFGAGGILLAVYVSIRAGFRLLRHLS